MQALEGLRKVQLKVQKDPDRALWLPLLGFAVQESSWLLSSALQAICNLQNEAYHKGPVVSGGFFQRPQ